MRLVITTVVVTLLVSAAQAQIQIPPSVSRANYADYPECGRPNPDKSCISVRGRPYNPTYMVFVEPPLPARKPRPAQ